MEVVRSVYESLNRGDWEAVFSASHTDFEMTTDRGPVAGTYRGQEAVKRQVEDGLWPFEAWAFEPEEFFERGDQVVVFVRIRSRPKGATVDMEVRIGHLWTIRDGLLRSLKTFAVREEALEAAGLEE